MAGKWKRWIAVLWILAMLSGCGSTDAHSLFLGNWRVHEKDGLPFELMIMPKQIKVYLFERSITGSIVEVLGTDRLSEPHQKIFNDKALEEFRLQNADQYTLGKGILMLVDLGLSEGETNYLIVYEVLADEEQIFLYYPDFEAGLFLLKV